ncbi:MAG: hypothetical protein GY946_21525, partial [bacterium]|nr:hypothetical protein [bacterium]
ADLVGRASGRPGLISALKRWANRIGLPLALSEDEDFAVIYPSIDHLNPENWEEEEAKQRRAARALATSWASRPPPEVSRQLAWYATEARTFGHQESEVIEEFFHTRVGAVDAPGEWLRVFVQERMSATWLSRALERMVRERRVGWEGVLELCFESDDYGWLAADIAIRTEGVSETMIDSALGRLSPNRVVSACLGQWVPTDTLRSVLEHERQEIAIAGAVGEWLSKPRGEVRPQIQTPWREAVLRLRSTREAEGSLRGLTSWLEEILGSDPDLAFAWLQEATGHEPLRSGGLYSAATNALPTERREEFLRQL